MRKLSKAGILALVMLIVFATAALALALSGIVGSWSNMVGAGATEQYQTVDNEVQALWGNPADTGKSGLGFTPNQSLPLVLDGEFEIGELRHFNYPVYAPWATAVDLTTVLTFTDPAGSASFTFTFAIDETTNIEPCPYSSTTPCSDRIGFPGDMPSAEFDLNGWIYELQVVGFKEAPEDPLLDAFISDEGQTNSALLYCELNLLRIEVEIDIKPSSYPNSINLGDQGLLPVAVLGSPTFDVYAIDLSKPITLGGTGVTTRGSAKAPKLAVSYEDVNGDGLMDLVSFFSVQDLVASGTLHETTTELMLEAETTGGVPISGIDSVRVVPPE